MPTTSPNPLVRARVLAVDDHPTNLRFLAAALDGRVGELCTACSGAEAIERLAERIRAQDTESPFDLILMDLHLTDMDGIEAWQRMRRSLGDGVVPKILALTADTREQQRDRVRAAGFDGLLGKPIERVELLQAMSSVLDSDSGFLSVGMQRRRPALLVDDEAATRAMGGLKAARTLQTALAEELQRELPELERLLLAGEDDRAAARLHRWRGACGYAGAQGLDAACRQLEEALQDAAIPPRATALAALHRAVQASVAAFRVQAALNCAEDSVAPVERA